MGISDLVKFLRKKSPRSFVLWDQPLSKAGTSIAIDVPLFAHKFCFVDGTTHTLEDRFEKMVQRLKAYEGIEQVQLVFDGQKTPLKDRERAKRAEHREKQQKKKDTPVAAMESIQFFVENPDSLVVVKDADLNVQAQPTSADFKRLQLYFDKRETISVIQAQQEAEAKVAHLVRTEQAAWALTDDSDVFAFLCPQTLLQYGQQRSREQVLLASILEDLQMNGDQFQQFCIFCGCDFLERLPLVGPERLYKAFQTSSPTPFLETAQALCKDEASKESHQQLQPEVLSFFQTCGHELQ